MKIQFEVGDLVRLKSGSQNMTVTAIHEDRVAVIYSVYQTGVIHTYEVPAAALVPAPESGDTRHHG